MELDRIDPDTYVETEQARLKVIARQLRLVRSFRDRLEAQFPKSRKPSVRVTVLHEEKRGDFLQVEVFGQYTKREHPYAVDGAIRKAGKGTAFWKAFHVFGTGTNAAERMRDNTFWATEGLG